MFKTISFGLLWLGFIIYAFVLAPPNQPDTWELIKNLSLLKWEGINPIIIALFYLLGIIPMIYACILLIDGRGQKIWAWPFTIFSFGVGAFTILPYLALRQPNPDFIGKKDFLIKLLDSRLLGISLTIAAISFLAFSILKGNWIDFAQQWQIDKFVHVMSLDFCLLCLLFPSIIGDDIERRKLKNAHLYKILGFVPLLGALVYLCLRPPLADTDPLN